MDAPTGFTVVFVASRAAPLRAARGGAAAHGTAVGARLCPPRGHARRPCANVGQHAPGALGGEVAGGVVAGAVRAVAPRGHACRPCAGVGERVLGALAGDVEGGAGEVRTFAPGRAQERPHDEEDGAGHCL
eukprot:CAMPEP_0179250888 /NCGR_PEP_ID=MMETSP0797-20121207/21403_1 /TAXON_ID=47934 /ORGANISM="Dinophysis acuminata, Strain DAEP01" /LENGTH=130 /DNA_ID=CAMNT_0020958645 /DNA_START=259 /DNA_END=651 /DNA_ORIENTATION=-